MKDPLTRVREAVIQAVPEILELKEGCEVRIWRKNNTEPWSATVILPCVGIGYWYCVAFHDTFPKIGKITTFHQSKDRIKILGRPICLADVLLAIGPSTKNRGPVYCTSEGVLIDFNNREEGGAIWNLHEDDLSKQSPECIEFLASLLTKDGLTDNK